MEKNILVVDDDISILDGFKEILSEEGYWVQSALNAEEALVSLKEHRYHVVLVDLVLKETTGLEIIDKIKAIGKDIDVIMITAYPSAETAVRSFRSGVTDYLVKPVKKQDLLDAIERRVKPVFSPRQGNSVVAANSQNDRAKDFFLEQAGAHIRALCDEINKYNRSLLKSLISGPQVRFAQSIKTDSILLHNLADNLSDVVKVDTEQLVLNEEDFVFPDLVREVTAAIYPAVREKSVELSYEIDPQIPQYLNGDRQRLRQILLNLLSNAAQFTEEGEIKLQARLMTTLGKGCHVFFVVKDSGPGIPKEHHIDIFKPVVHANKNHHRTNVGLGLWICKILVEKMGGLISVHSQIGIGCEFRFSVRLNLSEH